MRAEDIRDWWAIHKPAQARKSWNSWKLPHRATIPTACGALQISSLYELGCGAGPNLRLIAHFSPQIRLGGCEIRDDELEWASKQLPDAQIDKAACPHPVEATWEATLSCYTLAYLHPGHVLEQLDGITSRYLILVEPWGKSEFLRRDRPDISPRWSHYWPGLTTCTGWQLHYRWPIAHRDGLDSLAIFCRSSL